MFFCLLAFVVYALGPTVRRLSKRSTLDHLERIARRFGGEVVPAANGDFCAQLRINGQTYRVRICNGTDASPNLFLNVSTHWIPKPIQETDQIDLGLSPASFRMSITSAQTWNGLSFVKDVKTGNEYFDRRYFVQTNDVQILLDTLTAECQVLLNKIYVQFYERCEVRIVANQLQLDSAFRGFKPVKTFVIIRNFAELYQRLLSANEVAHSVDVDVIDFGGSTTCLICGEVVAHDPVKCRSCKTGYHLDCWEYVGRCGRYACGEQFYVASAD